MDLAKYNENAFPAMPIYFDDHGTRKKFEQAIKLALQPAAHQPAANLLLTQTGYLIEVIAPALQKEDFDIALNEDVLEVRTQRSPEAPNRQSYAYIQREYYHQGFVRKFKIPVHEIEASEIEATYEAGVLRIQLPFRADFRGPQALRIDVK